MATVPTSALRTGDTVLVDGVPQFVADAMERWPDPKEGSTRFGRRTKMWDVIFRDRDAIPAPHDQEWERVELART